MSTYKVRRFLGNPPGSPSGRPRREGPSHGPSRGGPSGGGRFGQSRSGGRPQGRSQKNRFGEQVIDVNRFVNKAVITEQVEHFVPEHAFSDFAIDEHLKENVIKKGYVTPTPIQDRTIPHILRGEDVVGIANTGTGKTAAFLLPLINKVLGDRTEKVIIMAPTRELAIQIHEEFRGFTPGFKMFSVCAVGGVAIGPQLGELRRSHNFLIGTPGRIKDLIERKAIDLSTFRTIVLDEADRMLDMGFIHDMKFIMAGMPKERHTLFFSATVSREIEALIGDFLRNPVKISVKTGDTAKNVDQDIVKIVAGKNKFEMLQELLKQPGFDKVIVFGRTKYGVEKLAKALVREGFRAESIHGNKPHNRRQKALGFFKEGKVQVLVATDVAARGLDIDAVSHVINFDIPSTYEDYVHRIGRTGRGEKKGKALTFVE
jgi:ATP-dependent RNA helicase RhlE